MRKVMNTKKMTSSGPIRMRPKEQVTGTFLMRAQSTSNS